MKICIIKVSLGGLNLFLSPSLRLLAVFPQSNRIVVFHNDDDDEDRLEILVLHECVELLCVLCAVLSSLLLFSTPFLPASIKSRRHQPHA